MTEEEIIEYIDSEVSRLVDERVTEALALIKTKLITMDNIFISSDVTRKNTEDLNGIKLYVSNGHHTNSFDIET